jgi:hypothetical protein
MATLLLYCFFTACLLAYTLCLMPNRSLLSVPQSAREGIFCLLYFFTSLLLVYLRTRSALCRIGLFCLYPNLREKGACLVQSVRQHTSAYVSIRQHTSAYVNTSGCLLGTKVPTAVFTSTKVQTLTPLTCGYPNLGPESGREAGVYL